MPLVRKKNGAIAPFAPEKIGEATRKALLAVTYTETEAEGLSAKISRLIADEFKDRREVSFNEIHDAVELHLMDESKQAAKAYILYRREREKARRGRDDLMDAIASITVETSKDNANIQNSPASKLYEMASEISKYYALKYVIPKEQAIAHENGDIHINDINYYQLTYNCLSFDLGKMLETGFQTTHGFIRSPKSLMSAAALTAVAFQSVQNSQYGGVAVEELDRILSKWVTNSTSEKELDQAMESMLFNLNTLASRAGNQVVFSSISIGITDTPEARRVASSILKMYDKGLGKGESCRFPNIGFKVAKGINFEPGTPNHELLIQSLDVTSRKMNPTYIFNSASFNTLETSAMGCRTKIQANRHGATGPVGRGNIAFNGINLPRIAIRAERDIKKFYRELDNTLKLCEAQLMHRWNILRNLKVKDISFIFGQGLYMGSEGMKPEDTIERALKNGTLSIGFIGLAETLVALTGKHHGENPEIWNLGYEIVKHIREFTDAASERHNLNFSTFASPAEGLSGRFTKMDLDIYGLIPGVTDKEYYSNSFHIPVEYEIPAYRKIELEAPFHELCNAGHISYIEIQEAPAGNVEGLYALLSHMQDNNMGYAGFNFPMDYCRECGKMGYFPESCAFCKSEDIKRTRRITGYFSEEENFNSGKKAELEARVKHA